MKQAGSVKKLLNLASGAKHMCWPLSRLFVPTLLNLTSEVARAASHSELIFLLVSQDLTLPDRFFYCPMTLGLKNLSAAELLSGNNY